MNWHALSPTVLVYLILIYLDFCSLLKLISISFVFDPSSDSCRKSCNVNQQKIKSKRNGILYIFSLSLKKNTSYNLHEAQVGGTIALIKNGDEISIDASENKINLHISKQEIINRKKSWIQPKIKASSGSLFKYANVVSSASKGCVTDEFN